MNENLPQGVALRTILRCLLCQGTGTYTGRRCAACDGSGIHVTDYSGRVAHPPRRHRENVPTI